MRFRMIVAVAALLAVPVAFALGAASPAQTTVTKMKMPKSSVPKFKLADKNHDGKIEWREAKAVGVPKALFKRDDFNHSGTLNKTEWMFVRLDMTRFKPAASGTAG